MKQINHLKSKLDAPANVSTIDKSENLFSTSNIAPEGNKDIGEEGRLHPINFDSIIGHDDVKEEIIYAIAAKLNADEESKAYRASIDYHAARGVLIYGLPGVGKSEFLRCVGASFKDHPDIDYKHISCSDFQGNVGNNASKIDEVFDEARNTSKKISIIGVDEIDSVMRKKKGLLNDAERTNAMQSNLDGIKDNSKIIIIATTNSIANMESASLSRFTIMTLGLPTQDDRMLFIKKYIQPHMKDIVYDINIISKYTEGFTGRAFRDIGIKLDEIRLATRKPITYEILIRQIAKYMTEAGRNIKRMSEDEEGNPNCIKQATPFINTDNQNVYKREPLTLDSSTNQSGVSMLDIRTKAITEVQS